MTLPSIRIWLQLLTLIGGVLLCGNAKAQSCSVTFTNIAFGSIDVLPSSSINGAGTVTSVCSGIPTGNKVLLCIGLNNGTNALSGTWRQMALGANRLLFNLYQDSPRTTVWNTTGSGVKAIIVNGNATVVTSVFGLVAGSQPTVPPGVNYTTTMTPTGAGLLYTTTVPSCTGVTLAASLPVFTVTATVVSSCTASAGNLTFPNTSFFTSNIDAQSTVTVTCTNTTPYHVRLDGGTTAATNPALRKMSNGANQVTYGLYRDSLRSLGWGSTDSTNTVDATGNSLPALYSVYGRIPPQASQPPAIYTDTVVLTVSFL